MPIYEYACQDCGHRYSEFARKMSATGDEATPPCPACASPDARRGVSSFAVQGPSGPDAAEAASESAQAARAASVTPKAQIDRWRSGRP